MRFDPSDSQGPRPDMYRPSPRERGGPGPPAASPAGQGLWGDVTSAAGGFWASPQRGRIGAGLFGLGMGLLSQQPGENVGHSLGRGLGMAIGGYRQREDDDKGLLWQEHLEEMASQPGPDQELYRILAAGEFDRSTAGPALFARLAGRSGREHQSSESELESQRRISMEKLKNRMPLTKHERAALLVHLETTRATLDAQKGIAQRGDESSERIATDRNTTSMGIATAGNASAERIATDRNTMDIGIAAARLASQHALQSNKIESDQAIAANKNLSVEGMHKDTLDSNEGIVAAQLGNAFGISQATLAAQAAEGAANRGSREAINTAQLQSAGDINQTNVDSREGMQRKRITSEEGMHDDRLTSQESIANKRIRAQEIAAKIAEDRNIEAARVANERRIASDERRYNNSIGLSDHNDAQARALDLERHNRGPSGAALFSAGVQERLQGNQIQANINSATSAYNRSITKSAQDRANDFSDNKGLIDYRIEARKAGNAPQTRREMIHLAEHGSGDHFKMAAEYFLVNDGVTIKRVDKNNPLDPRLRAERDDFDKLKIMEIIKNNAIREMDMGSTAPQGPLR